METHYITQAPCADLYDVENFDGVGQYVPAGPRRQKYINARKGVQIDIDKYYLWLYRAVWDCDLQMSGFVKYGQEYYGTTGGIQNYFTKKIQSVVKVGVVQNGRDRKIPIRKNGKTTLVDDAGNPLPKGYPKDILYKIRSNPCFGTNGVAVYFDLLARFEDVLYAITDRDVPRPYFPNAVNVTYRKRKVIPDNDSDKSYYYYYSASIWQPVVCNISISPNNGTFYDYSTKKYFANIDFGYSGIADWVGLQRLDEDAGENATVRSRLSVDGINIASGTTYDLGEYGFTGLFDSAQLSVSVDWKISKERDL